VLNLMNKNRVEATLKLKNTNNENEYNVINWLFNNNKMEWIVFGGLYGSKGVVCAAKKEIKQMLHGQCDKLIFMNEKKIKYIHKAIQFIPFIRKNNVVKQSVEQLIFLYEHLTGFPNELELKLAYDKFHIIPETGAPLNPSIHNIGLIWFPPLVPIVPDKIRHFVDIIYKVSAQFNRKPLITLTTLSHLCFNATIPIHFDKTNEEDEKQSKEYFRALYLECKTAGYYPYRLDINIMPEFNNLETSHALLAQKIKQCLDPSSTLSPGRYIKSSAPTK
jgi:4-cresol dehydrogenase (hydroxylating)